MEALRVMCGEYAAPRYAAHLTRLFASLADAENLRALLALGDDEVSANHLADVLDMAPRDVQKRLDHLEELDLVCATLYGQVRVFRVEDAPLRDLLFGHVRTFTNA